MRTITVVGGNLYRVALEQLGDATAWLAIARLNGLTDPTIQGLVTLVIPLPAMGGTPELP